MRHNNGSDRIRSNVGDGGSSKLPTAWNTFVCTVRRHGRQRQLPFVNLGNPYDDQRSKDAHGTKLQTPTTLNYTASCWCWQARCYDGLPSWPRQHRHGSTCTISVDDGMLGRQRPGQPRRYTTTDRLPRTPERKLVTQALHLCVVGQHASVWLSSMTTHLPPVQANFGVYTERL